MKKKTKITEKRANKGENYLKKGEAEATRAPNRMIHPNFPG
jgi:hypothetical protein